MKIPSKKAKKPDTASNLNLPTELTNVKFKQKSRTRKKFVFSEYIKQIEQAVEDLNNLNKTNNKNYQLQRGQVTEDYVVLVIHNNTQPRSSADYLKPLFSKKLLNILERQMNMEPYTVNRTITNPEDYSTKRVREFLETAPMKSNPKTTNPTNTSTEPNSAPVDWS